MFQIFDNCFKFVWSGKTVSLVFNSWHCHFHDPQNLIVQSLYDLRFCFSWSVRFVSVGHSSVAIACNIFYMMFLTAFLTYFAKEKSILQFINFFFLHCLFKQFFLFSTTIGQILRNIFSKNKCLVLTYWIETRFCFVVLNSKKSILFIIKTLSMWIFHV